MTANLRNRMNFALIVVSIIGAAVFIENSLELSGFVVDAYTQKLPFNGAGLNQPSDPFRPNESVIVYARVTYNDGVCAFSPVTFAVYPPNINNSFIISNFTDQNGIATCFFRVPVDQFGEWTINVTSSIGKDIFSYDILKFNVTWVVKIRSVQIIDENFIPKNVFSHNELVKVKLELENEAMSPKDVTVIMTSFDSTEKCIMETRATSIIFSGVNILILDAGKISPWASPGDASIIFNLYDLARSRAVNPIVRQSLKVSG